MISFHRGPLAEELDRDCPVPELTPELVVPLGDWLAINQLNAREAAAVVEPVFEAHLVKARAIGSRRGRDRGLALAFPVTIVLILAAGLTFLVKAGVFA